jgi:hypothetical protein
MEKLASRNSVFMKQNQDFGSSSEQFNICLRKSKRSNRSFSIRQSFSRSQFSLSDLQALYTQIPGSPNLTTFIEENSIIDNLLKLCSPATDFKTNKQVLEIFSRIVQPGGQLKYGILLSIASTATNFLDIDSPLFPLALSILAKISFHSAEVLRELDIVDVVLNNLPYSSCVIILQQFSELDGMADELIEKNVLSYLAQIMFIDARFTLVVLELITSFACSSGMAVETMLSHSIICSALDCIDHEDECIREYASFMCLSLAMHMNERQHKALLEVISKGKMKNAIEGGSQTSVFNYEKMFLDMFYRSSVVMIERFVFEKFIYDKNEEISQLASEILRLFN